MLTTWNRRGHRLLGCTDSIPHFLVGWWSEPVGSQWAAAAPPFTDFLRVVRDEGPADYTYLWMIDLLPDDPRVFLEIKVSRPVEEPFLFSFPVPGFTPFLERIERDRVLYLSTRSSIELAPKQRQPVMTVARRRAVARIPFASDLRRLPSSHSAVDPAC